MPDQHDHQHDDDADQVEQIERGASGPKPWHLLDRWAAWGVRRDERRRQAAGEGRLGIGTVVLRLAVVLAALLVLLVTPVATSALTGWLHVLAQVALAGLAGAGVLGPTRRAHAWVDGFDAGRASLWLSAHEAQRRGLRPHEWIEAEAERDVARWSARYGPGFDRHLAANGIEVHLHDDQLDDHDDDRNDR